MKNSIILAVLFIPTIAFSQGGLGFYEYDVDKFFRVGFNGGMNINKIQGKSFANEYSLDYAVRGFMVFNVSQKFGLQPEVGYSQQSAKQSNDYSLIWDEISSNGNQLKVKLSYLKFGTILNYNLGATTTRVKLQFGPQWGMLLTEKVDSLKTSQDIFKKGDFSLAAGILYQTFEVPSLHFGARFEQGLTNINAIDDRDKWKNQSFQLFAGVTF
jgi:Outer membrane protein beta-barrel domain